MKKKSLHFKKEERLKSRKSIDKLFQLGQSLGQYPLRIVWTEVEVSGEHSPVQFALSVPKKRFKKASDRNRIRRLIREAYRLQKLKFYQSFPKMEGQLAIMIIYTGKDMPSFETICQAMKQLLSRMAKKYRRTNLPSL